MITRSQEFLLEALKASLLGIDVTYPADIKWDEIVREAKNQTVFGLISPVIPVSDDGTNQVIATYMRILYEQDMLIKLFDANDIPCVILKGCAAAIYYPKPFLRTMGDVDILVKRDKFFDAVRVMESNGYISINGKDEYGNPVNDVRHIGYVKNGIEFELHHHFSVTGLNIDDVLEQAISRREYCLINGYSIPILPDIENGLVLLGHIYIHFKDGTIGLRQILDWEMFFDSVIAEDEWIEKFVELADNAGLLKLSLYVTKLCNKYIGLTNTIEMCDDVDDELVDELIELVMDNGNFGRSENSQLSHESRSIRSIVMLIKNRRFFSFYLSLGLKKSNLWRKYPVLKPFAFFYGLFDHIGKGICALIDKKVSISQLNEFSRRDKLFYEIGVKTDEMNANIQEIQKT